MDPNLSNCGFLSKNRPVWYGLDVELETATSNVVKDKNNMSEFFLLDCRIKSHNTILHYKVIRKGVVVVKDRQVVEFDSLR